MSGNDNPVITIITSTLNAASHLPWTIASVRGQTYGNIQWIVVDGASTDGTVELLRDNEDVVDTWISEPDDGIYDAWNKALKHVRGDWVQFLGAGDEFESPTVLEELAPALAAARPRHDLVYGKLRLLSGRTRGEDWSVTRNRWLAFRPDLPPLLAVFHHVSLFSEGGAYDRSFALAADSLFLLRCLKRKDPLFIDRVVVRMPVGGASSTVAGELLGKREDMRLSRMLGLRAPLRHRVRARLRYRMEVLFYRLFGERWFVRGSRFYRAIRGRGRSKWDL